MRSEENRENDAVPRLGVAVGVGVAVGGPLLCFGAGRFDDERVEDDDDAMAVAEALEKVAAVEDVVEEEDAFEAPVVRVEAAEAARDDDDGFDAECVDAVDTFRARRAGAAACGRCACTRSRKRSRSSASSRYTSSLRMNA